MSRSHARSPSPSSSDDDDDGSPYQITEPPAPALAPVIPFWSQEYTLSASASLKGDRIRLCSSALHELLQLTSETAVPPVVLPSPTTFELQSTDHRRIKVYATVEEYTADEDQIQVPLSIWEAFVPSQSSAPTSTPARSELEPGPADNVSRSDDPMQTDHPAASVRVKLVELPKCIWARIAPMEPDYLEIANMRATLETYFRKFQTTVTKGEILRVPHINPKTKQLKEHGFIVADLKPADACLCLNTDMEVDIAPLDASIAEEAVRLKFTTNIGPVRSDNSGRNQVLYPDTDAQHPTELKAVVEGAVQKGRYMHYSVKTSPSHRMYRISVDTADNCDCDLYVSLIQEHPTSLDHSAYNVDRGTSVLNVPMDSVEGSPFIHIGVYGYEGATSRYRLTVRAQTSIGDPEQGTSSLDRQATEAAASTEPLTECSNCKTRVPTRSYPMHQIFCERNNVLCPRCNKVFQKSQIASHWHCELCEMAGSVADRAKHLDLAHSPLVCECGRELALDQVAGHRRSDCPERIISCRYCHLHVKAGPKPTLAKDILMNLTSHEGECGSRTIQCTKCQRNVQLKDIQTHHAMHQNERNYQKIFQLCSNQNCANPLNDQFPNQMKLCTACFKPFWSPRNDPGNQKLTQKIVQTYHGQLTSGCGNAFCRNKYCKTNPSPESAAVTDANEAALLAIELAKKSFLFSAQNPVYYLCVSDAAVHQRRMLATQLEPLGYTAAWCVKGLMEGKDNPDQALQWLEAHGPLPKGR